MTRPATAWMLLWRGLLTLPAHILATGDMGGWLKGRPVDG